MPRMTGIANADKGHKIDGRRLRRGRRGRYARRRIQGEDLLERHVVLLMAVMEHLGIPEYRCARSNRVYSYRQKIVLLVLRQRLRLSYRQFVEDLPSYRGVCDALGLGSRPHPTTLIRFARAVDASDLERVVRAFRCFCREDRVLAVDCTGFSNFLRSAHFVERCREFGIGKEPRSFTKGSFVVDTDSRLIVSARFSAVRMHDTRFVPMHVEDLEGMSIGHVLMDRGYDSEPLHRRIPTMLGCTTVAPCRLSRGSRGCGTHGIVRNQMKRAFEEGGALKELYGRRTQAETANFMVKTHCGSQILSRLGETRAVEGLCKAIAHDCKIVTEKGMVWNPSA